MRFIKLDLTLLLLGCIALAWSTNSQKNQQQMIQQMTQQLEQIDRANSAKLDQLIDDKLVPKYLKEIIPEEKLQQDLNNYKAKKERTRLVFSVALVLSGLPVFMLITRLLVWLLVQIFHGIVYLKKLFKCKARALIEHLFSRKDEEISIDPVVSEPTSDAENHNRYGKDNSKKDHAVRGKRISSIVGVYPEGLYSHSSAEKSEKINKLYSDEDCAESDNSAKPDKHDATSSKTFNRLANDIYKTILSDYHKKTRKVEESLRTQAENIEKQVVQFEQITETAKQAAAEHSEPIDLTLKDLAEQVSAIREYASHQQEKVEKLQDGYDWNIIRTFCLKIIRCIDNMESRIAGLAEQNISTTDLEEIRDELIFALESSGVEQFEPELNSNYRGQKKAVEAVKERKPTDDTNLIGKIAEIIRHGYQYAIDEKNVKIVRTAKVKLFAQV
jgi:hypothetical protein